MEQEADQRLFTLAEWSGYQNTMKVVPKQPKRPVANLPPDAIILKGKTDSEEPLFATQPAQESKVPKPKSQAPKKKKKFIPLPQGLSPLTSQSPRRSQKRTSPEI